MMLAEVVSWPEAVVGCVGFICLVSLWLEKWPWQRDIYYINKDEEEEE